jgi:hypothetical protein
MARRHDLQLDHYDTDKIENAYLETYDPILEPWVNQPITLLELGVRNGGSLALWRDYFPRGSIVGVDIRLPSAFLSGDRITLFEGSQADCQFLTHVAQKTAPQGFDIIVDDASHIASLTRPGFWHLFDSHLKPGGLYVIEDWGTGYWSDWSDGEIARPAKSSIWTTLWWKIQSRRGVKQPTPSHSYGMVGFVKELVDEQGAADLTRKSVTLRPARQSKFESLIVTPSIVFVKKRSN